MVEITRRKAMFIGGNAVIAGLGAMALKGVYTEATKTDLDRCIEWLETKPPVLQTQIMDEVEERAKKETALGRTVTELESRARDGTNIEGNQRLRDLWVRPYDVGIRWAGRLFPYMDHVQVIKPNPQHSVELLKIGVTPTIQRKNHELAHWMADQANIYEGVCDMVAEYRFDLTIDDNPNRIKQKLEYGFEGDGFEGTGIQPKNKYTRFLIDYSKRFKPEYLRELKNAGNDRVVVDMTLHDIETLAIQGLSEYRDKLVLGGQALMELQARLTSHELDYLQMDGKKLKETIRDDLKNYKGEDGKDAAQFDSGWSATTRLYALYSKDSRYSKDELTQHQMVSKDIGMAMMGYDPLKKCYPLLEARIAEMSKTLGIDDAQLGEMAEEWVEDTIVKRRQDQEKVKQIAVQVINRYRKPVQEPKDL